MSQNRAAYEIFIEAVIRLRKIGVLKDEMKNAIDMVCDMLVNE